MTEIPLYKDSSADFTQIIDLDNISVTIRLSFNIRNQYWRINLETENYELKGLKVVENFPLIYPHNALFPELSGDFFIFKVSDTTDDFTYDFFGTDYKLFYCDETELAYWREYNNL